jgi:quinol monooxygenase YgiN
VSGFGTEVSFRLGPGTLDEARALAARLGAAAEGCRRHVLFVEAQAGEYGCLAEWDDHDAAAAYGDRPGVRAVLDDLEARVGRPARVRLYALEETATGAP